MREEIVVGGEVLSGQGDGFEMEDLSGAGSTCMGGGVPYSARCLRPC